MLFILAEVVYFLIQKAENTKKITTVRLTFH